MTKSKGFSIALGALGVALSVLNGFIELAEGHAIWLAVLWWVIAVLWSVRLRLS